MFGRRTLLGVTLAAAVLPYFVGLGATSIVDANEAYYAETPREMIEASDYLNPTFNYEPRFNKPPLSYWVVAGFYHVFGTSLWAARLPIALGAAAVFATVFLLGRLVFSTEAGLIAALTLAATPRFLLFSRRIIIDVHTAMFCGLVLLFFALAEARPARRRLWLVLMYAAAGLGVLIKGPVAVVLPALVFGVYLGLSGRLHIVRRLMLPLGLIVVALIVLPYYLAIFAQHGWTHIRSFVFTENIARFAEGSGAPDRGVFFYVPVVLADLYFPWSLLLPVALALAPWRRVIEAGGWRRWSRLWKSDEVAAPADAGGLRLLLALWILVITAFFSLSRAQQDLYVLPVVAGAAPLVGGLLDGWLNGHASAPLARAVRWVFLAMCGVLAAVGLAAAWLLGRPTAQVFLAGTMPAGLLLATGSILTAILVARHARLAAVITVTASVVCANWILVAQTLPDYERYKHVPALARVVQDQATPAAQVCTYRLATPSLVYALRRHVVFIEEPEALRQFVQNSPEVYCLMREEDYRAIAGDLGVQATAIAEAPMLRATWRDLWNGSPVGRAVLVGRRDRLDR